MDKKELKIVFTKSKKKFPIISWLIMLWTRRPYSHCARHVNVMGDLDLFYQASEGKVNYEVGEVFDKKHEIIKSYTISLDKEHHHTISRSCLEDAGKSYGILQNVGIILVDLLKLMNKKISNPWKDGRNCSELIFLTVLKKLEPKLSNDPDTIKPHHIEDILLKLGYKEDNINNYKYTK